jgi:hypothetical protein
LSRRGTVFSKIDPDGDRRSRQPTKSESFDFGGAEFAPWVLGATM